MDGLSVAASVVGIATAGVQVSIKLITLATQISTASERITSIGNDISLTSGILHQLGELINQKGTAHGISIFSKGGLETTRTSAAICERIFQEIENEARKASEQIRGTRMPMGGKIKLSRMEKAKWPFLQPSIDVLRTDLREAKGTLMLMLQVTSLALSKKMADSNSSASTSIMEQQNIVRAIIALQQQQRADGRQEGQAKDVVVANLKEADNFSPGGTSNSLTSVPFKKDTLSSLKKDSPRTASPTSYKIVEKSARQDRDSKVDAVDDTPKDLEQSTPFAAIGLSDATNVDTSQQSHSRELGSDTIGDVSVSQQQTPKRTLTSISTEKIGDTRHVPLDLSPSEVKTNSISSKSTSKNNIVYHHRMFLIRPSVHDEEKSVRISWTLMDTNIQQADIRKQLILYELENLPSVLEQLQTLHAYEQSQINDIIDHRSFHLESNSRYELVALKRTWTSIHHREMFFDSLPGLQFVIRKVQSSTSSIIQPPVVPMQPNSFGRTSSIHGDKLFCVKKKARPRGIDEDESEIGYRKRSVRESLEVSDAESLAYRNYPEAGYESDAEPWPPTEDDEEAEEVRTPEKDAVDDADEEQVVAELLGKYTTLYE